VIEKAGTVDHVVLDKTGTVTEGRPVVTQITGIGISREEALQVAFSLERQSEHSLGKAVVDAAKGIEPYPVTGFTAVPGKGVQGTLNGRSAFLGSRNFMASGGISDVDAVLTAGQREMVGESERSGETVVYLSCDGSLRGLFVISDRVRSEAGQAIEQLKKAVSISLVTGDNADTARAVAERIGIDRVQANISPLGKAEEIRKLQAAGSRVLMAGDGINDAPALVQANVGVAMGRATDIALESADMVIMRPDLRLVPLALALSRKTLTVIRQNIFWAFFYNLVVIPLAVAGVLHPIVAAGAMAFSSLSVVGNSLRARVS
jgi:P-type E1-E2 ATPase